MDRNRQSRGQWDAVFFCACPDLSSLCRRSSLLRTGWLRTGSNLHGLVTGERHGHWFSGIGIFPGAVAVISGSGGPAHAQRKTFLLVAHSRPGFMVVYVGASIPPPQVI